MSRQKKVFLLGGNDLEMETIKSLLLQHGEIYIDKNLQWDNAKLLHYAEELIRFGDNPEYAIYGIELNETENLYIPDNYYRIDHHNDYVQKDSSLEQVAALLSVTLNREQALIAANDKGYIPAMKALGASDEEIQRIRLADRQAQGVTEKDEDLALKALADRTTEKNVIIVPSKTNRFSPITDRLFPFDRLLIYTSDELVYYGKGKHLLVDLYADEIKKGYMFHGGGKDGFIGTVRSAYTQDQIIHLKNRFVEQIKP